MRSAARARPGAAGLGAGSDAAPPPPGLAAFASRRAPVTVTASPPRRNEPRRAAPPAPRSGTCRAGGAGAVRGEKPLWLRARGSAGRCCGRAGPGRGAPGRAVSALRGPGIQRSGDPGITDPRLGLLRAAVSAARRSAAEPRGALRPCPRSPPVRFGSGSSGRMRKQKKAAGGGLVGRLFAVFWAAAKFVAGFRGWCVRKAALGSPS